MSRVGQALSVASCGLLPLLPAGSSTAASGRVWVHEKRLSATAGRLVGQRPRPAVLPIRSLNGPVHSGTSSQHCAGTDPEIRVSGARGYGTGRTRGGAPRRRARPQLFSIFLPCVVGAIGGPGRGPPRWSPASRTHGWGV